MNIVPNLLPLWVLLKRHRNIWQRYLLTITQFTLKRKRNDYNYFYKPCNQEIRELSDFKSGMGQC